MYALKNFQSKIPWSSQRKCLVCWKRKPRKVWKVTDWFKCPICLRIWRMKK